MRVISMGVAETSLVVEMIHASFFRICTSRSRNFVLFNVFLSEQSHKGQMIRNSKVN